MTALVLGGSGFIGMRLVARLLAAGETVVATTRRGTALPAKDRLTWRQADLADFDDWPALLTGVSHVFHLAWSTIPETAEADPVGNVSTNVLGSIRLLEALKAHKGARLIFVSSGGAVYGEPSRLPVHETDPTLPVSAHGVSKLEVEHYIDSYRLHHGLDAIVLRIANAFGEGQLSTRTFGAVSTFCHLARTNRPLHIFGDGTIVRDYLHVEEAVDALLRAAHTQSRHRVFNIGSGVGHSLNDVVHCIEKALGRKALVQFESKRPFDIPASVLDVTRAAKELDWRPQISLEQGIARLLSAPATAP